MPRGRSTFTKRQKEQTRQQKQREKAERRVQRNRTKPEAPLDEMQELREPCGMRRLRLFRIGSEAETRISAEVFSPRREARRLEILKGKSPTSREERGNWGSHSPSALDKNFAGKAVRCAARVFWTKRWAARRRTGPSACVRCATSECARCLRSSHDLDLRRRAW